MNLLRLILCAIAIIAAMPAWPQSSQPSATDEDSKFAQILADGAQLFQSRKFDEAIERFDMVAASYEGRYKDDKTKYFSARTQVETLLYLLESANAKTGNALVISANWAYAYYLKAYALVELRRVAEAKLLLERALALSPQNSQFLSELGSIYQGEKNWPLALETFQRAESAAKTYSPPSSKNIELSRAWRGIGYVYVEQNRLDDAEKMYLQCLEIDKNDTKAMNELRYIRDLKIKSGA